MTDLNKQPNPGTKSSKPARELDDAALDSAAGGTKHPAKVTVPDPKLAL